MEASGLDQAIIVHGIEQIESVLGPDVEWVAGEGSLQVFAAAFDLADAQSVDAAQGPATP